MRRGHMMMEGDMSAWKKALEEPNAAGWIAFLMLMFLFGFLALYFDAGDEKQAEGPVPAFQAAH